VFLLTGECRLAERENGGRVRVISAPGGAEEREKKVEKSVASDDALLVCASACCGRRGEKERSEVGLNSLNEGKRTRGKRNQVATS